MAPDATGFSGKSHGRLIASDAPPTLLDNWTAELKKE
jgi:hypothetical protein